MFKAIKKFFSMAAQIAELTTDLEDAIKDRDQYHNWWVSDFNEREQIQKELRSLKARHIMLVDSMRSMGYKVEEFKELEDGF